MCVWYEKRGWQLIPTASKNMWLRNPLGGLFLFKDRIVEPCLCSHQKRWKCTLDYAVETVETQNERIRSLKRDHVFRHFIEPKQQSSENAVDGRNPSNYLGCIQPSKIMGINYLSTGTGFLPSAVC